MLAYADAAMLIARLMMLMPLYMPLPESADSRDCFTISSPFIDDFPQTKRLVLDFPSPIYFAYIIYQRIRTSCLTLFATRRRCHDSSAMSAAPRRRRRSR